VRGLAERVRSGERRDRHSPLVPLAAHRGRPVVVLVHAASGSVLPFRELAEQLERYYSVYALQTPPCEDPGAPIEELARLYTAELAEVVGANPVCLVGWSMGGCVALEMARRWQDGPVEVAATVMLDSWVPPALAGDDDRRDRQRQAILELDIHGAEGLDQLPAAAVEQLGRVTEQNRRALADYRPQPYPGPVALLHAAEPLPITTQRPVGEPGSWRAVLTDLRIEETGGSHFSLLRGEHAVSLAERIDDIFDGALDADEV
jgi:thioesterase domain-containing protein